MGRTESKSAISDFSLPFENPIEEDKSTHQQQERSFLDGKFNLRRMLRLTSNDMDSDPRFFKQLLLYNEMHHKDYNP